MVETLQYSIAVSHIAHAMRHYIFKGALPHGHWKIIFKGTIAEGLACSECGKRGYGENLTNFCPNCGAKMEDEGCTI